MPFSSFELVESLLQAVSHHHGPTAIQAGSIRAILSGVDILATAPTGSGKTTAFVLPLLQRWHSRDDKPGRNRPLNTLILVPTRELAAQVREVVQECSVHLPDRPKIVSAVGGVSINPQMMALRGGADFVIATPGRLLDLVERNALSLSGLRSLVLDEADRLLDLGFSEELKRIFELLPEKRQNLLFSATFPKKVEDLALEWLHSPTRVEIHEDTENAPDIVQRSIRVDTGKRTPLLRHLIEAGDWKRVLVFVASQYTADHVALKLRRNGVRAWAFHGDLGQGARSEALDDFKNSHFKVLVATDLAARGLDIVQLPVVVNYDLPRSSDDYTHRIGRTGRAGESGIAVSFVTAENEAHFRLIEKRNDLRIAREEIEGFEPTESAEARPASAGTGGIKGPRKSKKDKLREAAARKARE
ncbi:MAG: DEAD/DEAH box helicase [Verrucomicrobiales bacterium]|nr:DEAD/DEAH box helicase [Verrucomicrobiales bacterium]